MSGSMCPEVVALNAEKPTIKFQYKVYLVSCLVIIWSANALLIKYASVAYPDKFSSSLVVALSEGLKFTIASVFFFAKSFNGVTLWQAARENLSLFNLEMLKMSIPSICYTIQNNVEFVALEYMPASTYIVLCQLKIVTTAIFMMVLLKRRFSCIRWIGILLVTLGSFVVTANIFESNLTLKTVGNHYGLAAVLLNCFLAGFAGTYCEKAFKDTTDSVWLKNMQLYFWGFLFGSTTYLSKDFNTRVENYTLIIFWAIILSFCFGGIYVSLVMKHMDNLMKSFAAAFSIIMVNTLSVLFLDNVITVQFIVGSAIVIFGIGLYNYVQK